VTTLAPEQIEKIVNHCHQDPFEVLGSHQIQHNNQTVWVVRAYLPKADAVWVVCPQQPEEYPMQAVGDPHFFECCLDVPELKNYQLKIQERDRVCVIHDPYAFRSPQLSEFDIYLFGEGNHHRIYEKLGSHLSELEGVRGVYFAVWAPNARNVSVVGNFNDWDGREHQMRLRGNCERIHGLAVSVSSHLHWRLRV
jgi:1,4-alpha-glucan branching enzyme